MIMLVPNAAQHQILCGAAKACTGSMKHVHAKPSHLGRKVLFRMAAPGTGLWRADGARRSLACRYRDPSFADRPPGRRCLPTRILRPANPVPKGKQARPTEGSLTRPPIAAKSKRGASAPIALPARRITRVDHPSIVTRYSGTMPKPRCGASTIGSCRRNSPDNTARPPGASAPARSRASTASGRANMFDRIRS